MPLSLSLCQGITEDNLDKLLSHALIPADKKTIITNMQHLNLQIVQDQSRVSVASGSAVRVGFFSLSLSNHLNVPSAWKWSVTGSRQSDGFARGIGIVHKVARGDSCVSFAATSMIDHVLSLEISPSLVIFLLLLLLRLRVNA